MKIKSVFGAYADKLQVTIDSALDLFAPTWFENYFTWGPQQTSLTFVSVIGQKRIEAAASIIARGSAAPLRARPGLDKLTGEIPQIAEKFKLDENDYREFLTLQAMAVSEGSKKQQLLDLMFGDVTRAGNAAMKRLDIMCLEGVSTGQISLTIDTNPDGLVLQDPVDLLMPDENKVFATASWDDFTNSKPFDDIMNVINDAEARGISFDEIWMTRSRFLKMIQSDQVKSYIANFLNLRAVNKVMPTRQNINDFLGAQGYPPIVLQNQAIGIEKDGIISTIRPFKDENVVFRPAGSLGIIKHAVCVEELRPVENVAYSKFNRALISKYAENDPFQEFTKVELNAFPSIEAIDSIHILYTTETAS